MDMIHDMLGALVLMGIAIVCLVIKGNSTAKATHLLMNSRFDAWKAETLKAATEATLAAQTASGMEVSAAYREGVMHGKAEAESVAMKVAEARFKVLKPPMSPK